MLFYFNYFLVNGPSLFYSDILLKSLWKFFSEWEINFYKWSSADAWERVLQLLYSSDILC